MVCPVNFKLVNKSFLFSWKQWEEIEKKIIKYLEVLFSERLSKWEFNKLLNKLIENSMNVPHYQKIKKYKKWVLDTNEIPYIENDEKIEFVTNKIKEKINWTLRLLYREVVKELIIKGKEKNRILKFEFQNNKLENEKEFYWKFFNFLKKNWLNNVSYSESELKNEMQNFNSKKYHESFFSNYESTSFRKTKAWILMFSSKVHHKLEPKLYHLLHGSKNSPENPLPLLKMFTSIEDLHLGSKNVQNEEYDFSKIDFILFYKEALQINRLPIGITVYSNPDAQEILFTIRGEWWIKLILENILLFTLQNN